MAEFDLSSLLILAVSLDSLFRILLAALGLGLVIFFHELGHFAVAKWCNVNVERFSIGFGPVIWSQKWGETEYALSAIPFGGYVKMLGQDDMDPSQLTQEEIAQDPRSYSAKPVHQRMAIISAGVTMNIVTGLAFFAIAFRLGVDVSPAIVGFAQVGRPAWQAGVEQGDRITAINDRPVDSFGDIMRGVALSTGPVAIDAVHPNGDTYEVSIVPDTSGTRRMIGVGPTLGLTLFDPPPEMDLSPVVPGTPAAEAVPPFEAGDTIRRINDTDVSSFAELQQLMARKRAESLDFYVQRKNSDAGKLTKITVAANRMRTLGLWMDGGQLIAIQDQSPAAKAGLKVGDKIALVNGKDVGKDINAFDLPNYMASLAGQNVVIQVVREVKGDDAQKIEIALHPRDVAGWLERPLGPDGPVSVPAIGVAYHLIPTVLKVSENSPAAKAGIVAGDRLKSINLVLPDGAPNDMIEENPLHLDFDGDKRNVAFALWMLQDAPLRNVEMTVRSSGDGKSVDKTVALVPQRDETSERFVPTRGIRLMPLAAKQKADSLGTAIAMGINHTQNSMTDIYLTLRNLFGGLLSVKELHGPIGIAKVAYEVSEQGFSALLLFLGFLSVNLAVLNFLPIPVLDGGHMVFLIWEGVTRRRPSERVLAAATYAGMLFVLGLMLLVLYIDIFVHQMAPN